MNKTEIKQIIKEEAKKVIFEISTKAGLEDVAKGRTTSIEGIKVSKEMVENMVNIS
jgi:hypothetical protein